MNQRPDGCDEATRVGRVGRVSLTKPALLGLLTSQNFKICAVQLIVTRLFDNLVPHGRSAPEIREEFVVRGLALIALTLRMFTVEGCLRCRV